MTVWGNRAVAALAPTIRERRSESQRPSTLSRGAAAPKYLVSDYDKEVGDIGWIWSPDRLLVRTDVF